MPQLPSSTDVKSIFLTGKEKFVGALMYIIPGGILLGMFGLPLLQWLQAMILTAIGVVGYSIVLTALLAILGTIIWIGLQERTWTLLYYQSARAARAVTDFFVKQDPIGTMKTFAENYLQKKLTQIAEKLSIVKKARKVVSDKVDGNIERMTEMKDLADQLHARSYNAGTRTWKNTQDEDQFREMSNNHAILEQSTDKLQKQLDRLDLYVSVLEKFMRAFETQMRNTQFLVEVLTTEYEAAKATAEATQTVSALFGEDDHKKVFDMSVRYTRDQVATFIADADTALSFTKDFTQENDLKGDVYAQKMLDRLSARADALIQGAQQDQKMIADGQVIEVLQGATRRELAPVVSLPSQTSSSNKKYRRLLE